MLFHVDHYYDYEAVYKSAIVLPRYSIATHYEATLEAIQKCYSVIMALFSVSNMQSSCWLSGHNVFVCLSKLWWYVAKIIHAFVLFINTLITILITSHAFVLFIKDLMIMLICLVQLQSYDHPIRSKSVTTPIPAMAGFGLIVISTIQLCSDDDTTDDCPMSYQPLKKI